MLKISIGSHEDFEAFRFGDSKQLTVFKRGPSPLICRLNSMIWQRPSERHRRTLVEENPHSDGRQRALRCVFENLPRVIRRDAWKPLQERGYVRTVLKVLKQGGDGHARSPEHPSSADSLRIALYCRTCRPVDHRHESTPDACLPPNK